MASAPVRFCTRSPPTLADSEMSCSARGGARDVLDRRSSSRGLWELGCRSRSKSMRFRFRHPSQSRVREFDQEWWRGSQEMSEGCSGQEFQGSRSWNFRFGGGQRGKGPHVRTQGLRFARRNEALVSRIRGVSLKNSFRLSSPEEVTERVRWQGGGRKRSVSSSRLYASRDPYETLGVPSTATDKEIKQAYRKLALKFHPDVNKEANAQQKFMQIKNAYQTLTDENSRAKYNASKRSSPSWDPFSWESERSSAKKPQQEEFYGFEDFFRDLQADRSRQESKPKSLWEELADIGEEFVEFLEKELNINDATPTEASGKARNDKKKSDAGDAKERSDARDAKKKPKDSTENGPRDQSSNKAQVETEIEDLLAQLKKEMGM